MSDASNGAGVSVGQITDPSVGGQPPVGGNPRGGAKSAFGRILGGAAGRNLGLVIALIALCIVGAISAGPRFTDVENFMTIIRFASVTGVLSIGVTFVIIAGGIDLSVGSVLGLATVIPTLSAVQTFAGQSSWLVMVLIALAVGAVAGLINGVVIAYGNVVAFIATLSMLVAARGLAEIFANRSTQIVRDQGFLSFFRGDFLGVSPLIWIFLIVAIAGWVLLNRTTFGRRTIAIGGNLEAARLAGIKVKRHTMYLYVLAGLTAGIGAVMMMARTTVGTSTHGTLYELDVIAAIVVGGTLLVGGRGTIVGTVFGVLIFAVLTNIFTLNNLNTSVQAVVKGVIIVIAVLLQRRFAERSSRR
ncbi:ABC transporter permease [Herbiconiux sp. L3-i23]|uniref:ABC transporter permease n=1 Tax=Herbiconiux sp. L3-i23 TaxID=2905871 RepID=UPI0020523F1D|nr:ABC transporter permease [Herbiconiux sp. L3-i23]BDI21492.1 sugar ABC transporter permease [Herbiconiux sp. L3-i23]